MCTGNICRSPYAEYKLKLLLPDVKIASAGTGTKINRLQGKPADRQAIEIANSFGVDISQHKATQVTQALMSDHDLILVMEPEQKEALLAIEPNAFDKIYLFGHWINLDTIDDPYRQGKHAFLHAFTTIDKASAEWAKRFYRLV